MERLNQLLSDLQETVALGKQLAQHQGRTYGRQLGVVLDRDDPLGMGRVRATVASKGGRYQTDWLTREEPCSKLSLPVPKVGESVWASYTDGDPHKGAYSGVVQNNINPAADKDSLKLQVGKVILEIHPEGVLKVSGCDRVEVISDTTEFRGDVVIEGSLDISEASSVSINGSQVATIGARDDDGDILDTKGW